MASVEEAGVYLLVVKWVLLSSFRLLALRIGRLMFMSAVSSDFCVQSLVTLATRFSLRGSGEIGCMECLRSDGMMVPAAGEENSLAPDTCSTRAIESNRNSSNLSKYT